MTKIRTVFHPPSAEGRDALNRLAADLYTRADLEALGATVTVGYIGGRGIVTTASLGNVSTPLTKLADGSYRPDYPEVLA